MTIKDPMGTRLKEFEAISETRLLPRTPVIIRVDGKAFHHFLRDAEKPFDINVHQAMYTVAEALVENVQGACLAYFQSDECSVLVTDWERYNTQSWFNYRTQKVASISASLATVAFNQNYVKPSSKNADPLRHQAMFDARCFNIPQHEVVNYFIWRQQDATRNSLQMYGQHHLAKSSLHGQGGNVIQDRLFKEVGINWNDVPTWHKRGSCVYKLEDPSGRPRPYLDQEIPIFSQNREFIENFVSEVFNKEHKDEPGEV